MLQNHIISYHAFPCEQCLMLFQSPALLAKHKESHVPVPNFNCDQCDFKSNNTADLNTHIKNTHSPRIEAIECRHCDFRAVDKQNMDDHIECDHMEFAMMKRLTANQNGLHKNIEQFKEELTNILNIIIDDHNVIKQELLCLRQKK